VRSTGLEDWAWNPPACFPIIVLLSLVTAAHGGWVLLGFLTAYGTIGAFR
jgi:hypothetical protein